MGEKSRWHPAIVVIYLGHSTIYAGSVTMVLNPRTLRVLTQYHIVFDDNFSTAASMVNCKTPENWKQLVSQSKEFIDLRKCWAS